MRKIYLACLVFCSTWAIRAQQHINFKEYNLENGLHVILHQDKSAPLVVVGVMYHVGAKDEAENRSGFAHLFEHLLFDGTENIASNTWQKIVAMNGGVSEANTTQDRTYFYDVYPAQKLKLALWMESERMLHSVINEYGVAIQSEIVKEEKRMRIDNAPYGKLKYGEAILPYLFNNHPYKEAMIGTLSDINSAKLSEFISFYDTYYVPNNAVLVISGNFDEAEARQEVLNYFSTIPRGKQVPRVTITDSPVNGPIQTIEYDNNIEIPAKIFAYRTPGISAHDRYVLDMISVLLSNGKSSRLYTALVQNKQLALKVLSYNRFYEDYGTFVLGGLPFENTTLNELGAAIQDELTRIKTELITEREYEKLLNKIKNRLVNQRDTQQKIAADLAEFYTLYRKQTGLINAEFSVYQNISREEIRRVANKYFVSENELELNYLPSLDEENK